jgi:hypothetical protein
MDIVPRHTERVDSEDDEQVKPENILLSKTTSPQSHVFGP